MYEYKKRKDTREKRYVKRVLLATTFLYNPTKTKVEQYYFTLAAAPLDRLSFLILVHHLFDREQKNTYRENSINVVIINT